MSQVIKNYIYNLSYQILVVLTPLILSPYISRTLGAERIGDYSYAESIVFTAVLLGCIGLNIYGQREIAYCQNDVEKRSRIFKEILICRFVTLSISFCVLMAIIANSKFSHFLLLLQSVEIFNAMIDITWFYQGLEQFKFLSIRNILVKIACILLIITFVKDTDDLPIYMCIYVFLNTAACISLWLGLSKKVINVKIDKKNLMKHVKMALILFLPQVAVSCYSVLDKIMLGSIVENKAELGYYEQALRLVKTVMTVVTSLGTIMLPRIASLYANKDKNSINRHISKSFMFVFAMGLPLVFGIISVIEIFVPIFFGKGYDKVIPNVYITAPLIFIIGFSNVIGTQYLIPTHQEKRYTKSVLTGAAVNFCLNMILISKLASVGACIASVMAEATVAVYEMFLTRKHIKYCDVIKGNKNFILSSLGMFIVVSLLKHFFGTSILDLLLLVVIGGSVYVIELFLLKEPLIYTIILKK